MKNHQEGRSRLSTDLPQHKFVPFIIGRRHSRNITKLATSRSSATRSPSTRARCTRGLAASGFLRFVLAGVVTRYIILGCM